MKILVGCVLFLWENAYRYWNYDYSVGPLSDGSVFGFPLAPSNVIHILRITPVPMYRYIHTQPAYQITPGLSLTMKEEEGEGDGIQWTIIIGKRNTMEHDLENSRLANVYIYF